MRLLLHSVIILCIYMSSLIYTAHLLLIFKLLQKYLSFFFIFSIVSSILCLCPGRFLSPGPLHLITAEFLTSIILISFMYR